MANVSNVIQMLKDISTYDGNTLADNVKRRLDDTLALYIHQLNLSYEYSISKAKSNEIIKELSKDEH